MTPHPRFSTVAAHLDSVDAAAVLPWELSKEKLHVLDLSVGSKEIGGLEILEDVERFTSRVFASIRSAGARVGVGRYDEARPIYTTAAFQPKAGEPLEPRTVHLGIDLFVDAGTKIRAPLDGRVHSFANNAAPLDYGPTIILEHVTDSGDRFFTLYGHLAEESLGALSRGKRVSRGEPFARVGDFPVNGNWPPHLHFQVILDLLGKEGDFPGVAPPSEPRGTAPTPFDRGVASGSRER
jgi:murein DD-endopeptidase MepM/ murein hydrolase activator NlpD